METLDCSSINGSRKYHFPLYLLLITAGLAGNYFKFSILNADFVFGSIFAMLALQLFGLGRGILAATIIASYTYLSWNHPYAIITMTAEVAFVGIIINRYKTSLLMADALYWLFVGIPLGYGCFHLISDLPAGNSIFLMTKQAINGMANALLARLIFTGYALRSHTLTISFREVVSNLMAFFVMCTALIMLTVASRVDFAETDRQIRTAIINDSLRMTDRVDNWVQNRKPAILTLAEMATVRTPQQMQHDLEQAKKSDVNFRYIGLQDKDATTTAIFPLLDELGRKLIGRNYADRPFIPTLKRTLKPMLSEVVVSRTGPPEPMVSMLAPVVIRGEFGGHVIGILGLGQIQEYLNKSSKLNSMFFTLIDKNGNIIMSNRKDQKVMTSFVRANGTLNHLDEGISQWVPVVPPNTSTIELWGKSLYVAEFTIGEMAEWKLVLEQPVAPFQKKLYAVYTGRFSLVFLILVLALAIADLSSRWISATNEQLGNLTRNLPSKLASGTNIVWPVSAIREHSNLMANFREMADSLKAKFIENRQIQETLEQRVEERTQELREANEYLNNLFNYANAPIIVWDQQFRIARFNHAFELITGRITEEALGNSIEILFPPDRIERSMELIRKTQSGERWESVEIDILNINGTVRTLLWNSATIFSDEGIVPVATIAQGYDITEHKQAEAALRESEYEFRSLAEAMPQIVWITRPDGWNIYFNEQWVTFTGLTLEESYGHGWNKPFHPDDKQRAWDTWQNATKTGGIYSLECRLRRADGFYTWWLIRGVPMLDARGTILKWFGTCTDINELKHAEESLRMHSERLKNLNRIDQAILLALESPEAVVQTALHHMRGLLQCQRASVGIFDLRKKEVRVYAADVDGQTIVQVGKTLTEEVYGIIDILRQSRIEIVEDMSNMTSPSAINRILQAEGIQSSINVALVSALEMYGVLNIGWENPRAITPEETEIAGEVASQITIAIEKARLLKETKRYAAELEQRVEDRTAQLEASNKELEAFSYSVSHDLRAPLRHINGYVELLIASCRDSLKDKELHYVDTIADSARQMGVLIDDLLQFSRTGRTEMRREMLDMNKPLQEAWTRLEGSHLGRAIEWIIGDLPTVYADYALIRQAWTNLLDNAIKYTRTRKIAKVEIGVHKEDEEFIFFIKDNGVGFDMRYAGKLFGVFQRLHSLEDFEGTGIGLANVNRIITRHGGRIWAEAEMNQGATFYFTLSKLTEERHA